MNNTRWSEIPQRDAFWDRIFELASENKDIILVSADMGAPSLDKFRKNLPSQFVNVGIAEQNAITLAAGLAMTGKKVFTYAIAPFITLRCIEQIRVECCIMGLPLTMVGVGVGFGYEDSGPTHHLIEDIAAMRSMPNLDIHNITDSVMARAAADISVKSKRANYVRIHRQNLPQVYQPGHSFEKGFSVLMNGQDCAIVACGSMVKTALDAADALKKKRIAATVIDLHTLPVNPGILKALPANKKIVSIEEHFLPGGVGSALLELLSDNAVCSPVKRIGLKHESGYCYKYGGIPAIHAHYGLSDIQKQIADFLKP